MNEHQAVDGGSTIRIQKHDSRVNNGHDLPAGRLSDTAGDARKKEADEMAMRAGSVACSAKSAKSSADSSPHCQESPRARSVQKFVYEVDMSKLPAVGCAHPVSWSIKKHF